MVLKQGGQAGLVIMMLFFVGSPAWAGEREYCRFKFQWETAYYGTERISRLKNVVEEIKPGFSAGKLIHELKDRKRKIQDLKYDFQRKTSPLISDDLRVVHQKAVEYLDITIDSCGQFIRALEEVTTYPENRTEIKILSDYYLPKIRFIGSDISREMAVLSNTYPKACTSKFGRIMSIIFPFLIILGVVIYWINFK